MSIDLDEIAKHVAHPLVASPLGALVSLNFMPGKTIPEKLVNFASGSIIAWFGAPFLADWFALTRPQSIGFLSFTIGMVGLIVVSMAIETFKSIGWRDIAQGWLARKTGGQ